MLRVGIVGYGNLGKGVELALTRAEDMIPVALFTRREPESLKTFNPDIPVYSYDDIAQWEGEIDVLILCAGSAQDLPAMSPDLAQKFEIVDSFDNHSQMPEHKQRVDASARRGDHLALIAGGWDPGLFSIARVYGDAIMPQGKTYTFWGEGVSQGHSDAVRRISGVQDARQYTIPSEEVMAHVREGEVKDFTTAEKHSRHCYVVADEADRNRIKKTIKSMPGYFAEYNTTVEFISQEEMDAKHSGMPHGGRVLQSGKSFSERPVQQNMELALNLGSNPEFTAQVLVACARGLVRMHRTGRRGAISLLDVPPAYLSPRPIEELEKDFL